MKFFTGSIFRAFPGGILTLCLGLVSTYAFADADEDIRQAMIGKIAAAWDGNQFGVLEDMENGYLAPDQRTPSGKRLLAVFENNISGFISIRSTAETVEYIRSGAHFSDDEIYGPTPENYDAANKKWDLIGRKIDNWGKAFPNSPNPIIAKAIYYKNRGYYFRGAQYASQVHPEAWPILKKNYGLAREILVSTKEVSRKNPIWFSLMLDILGVQSASRDEISAAISDTLQHGQGYPNAIQSAFDFMQPKWGGSYDEMERFARLANQSTMNVEHGEIYARLYWNMVFGSRDEMNRGFFTQTKASWPLVKKSFEVIVKNHPTARNFSGYALFACMAGDLQKSKEMLTKAQTAVYSKTWMPELQQLCAS